MLLDLQIPVLIVLVDPMLEDPPAVVRSNGRWVPSPVREDCWHCDDGRLRLLGLRLWVEENASLPLGELCDGLDVPSLCLPVFSSCGVVAVGCTGHIRAVWDILRPSGALLAESCGRLGKDAFRRQEVDGTLVFNESGLIPCKYQCGAFHYDGPSCSSL